jgi:hypothetical protein
MAAEKSKKGAKASAGAMDTPQAEAPPAPDEVGAARAILHAISLPAKPSAEAEEADPATVLVEAGPTPEDEAPAADVAATPPAPLVKRGRRRRYHRARDLRVRRARSRGQGQPSHRVRRTNHRLPEGTCTADAQIRGEGRSRRALCRPDS